MYQWVLHHPQLVSSGSACVYGIQPRASQRTYSASAMGTAAGDLHAVKLQLSVLFVELRDKMVGEMVKFSEIKKG